jgi:hypothetical protein
MYSVRWKPSATNELAALWLSADSSGRRLLTESVRDAELLLRRDPETVGESRGGNDRVVFVNFLGIEFRVLAEDRIVVIGRVWRIASRP